MAIFHSAKMAFLNPCMKFKFFFGQKTTFEALRMCHIQKIFITCSRVHKIQDLGQLKYKLRLFSKRTHGISKNIFILGSYEFLASLESKIGRYPFFGVHNCKKTVCRVYYRFVIISSFLYNTFLFSAYELWFKQIIYEIDSIRDIFMGSEKLQQFSLMSLTAETLKPEAPSLDERVMLDINKRFLILFTY